MPNKNITQQQLEQKMHDDGVARYRKRYQGVKGRNETAGAVGRKVLASSVDIAEKGFIAWMAREEKREEEFTRKGARKGADLYDFVKDVVKVVDPKLISALACRGILDGISVSKKATRIAMMISSSIESEYVLTKIQGDAPSWFAHYRNTLGTPAVCKDKSTLIYRQKRLKEYLDTTEGNRDWNPWSSEMKARFGTLLIELFCNSTGLAFVQNRTNIRGRKYAAVTPAPGTLDALDSWHENAEILKPIYKPCLVQPKDWTTPFDGGYFSEKLYKTPLVKTPDKEYLKTLAQTDMPEVYKAINKLQATAWTVNNNLLTIMEEFWETGHDGAGLPAREDEIIPPKPHDVDTNEDARAEWRRSARDVYEFNDKQKSKRLGLLQTLVLANEYKDVDEFYFVWQLDWRGRCYPVSYFYLQPQGPDFGKALLMFKEGKPINTEAAKKWFFIHGANSAGKDKETLEDRVKWVEDNKERIREYANDPYYYSDWMEMSEPWCFLAFCLEFVEWEKDPENFISRIPVAQDATQSGLQILSLLVMDAEGAKATNLTKSDRPVDLYQSVADLTIEFLKEAEATTDEDIKIKIDSIKARYNKKKNKKGFNEKKELFKLNSDISCARRIKEDAKLWLDLGVDRSMVKRPVMTRVYNASNHSMVKYLKDSALDKGLDVEKQHVFKSCSFLAKYVKKAIDIKIAGAELTMKYLGQVANASIEANSSLWWTTPIGLPIKQIYKKLNSKTVSTCIDGKIRIRSITEETKDVASRKQRQAFSPNLVHSIDASLLMSTVNKMEGVKNFAMVHDSFGVLAADAEEMHGAIREAYIETFSQPVLQDLIEDIIAHLPDQFKNIVPDVPEMGSFDPEDMKEATFMFS